MKLLLTSAGLTNPEICQALAELSGRPLTECRILVVITASLVDGNDKTWFIKGLRRIHDQRFKHLDIVDIAALPCQLWEDRFEAADILFFAGGNPYHLLNQVRQTGLIDLLPELLKTRVYIGHSAGSAMAGPSLGYSTPKKFVPEGLGPQPIPALNLVDFCVRSHMGNPEHPSANAENVRALFGKLKTPVYAIGDYTAVKVDGREVSVVGDKNYFKLAE
jgi:dipeptidase E